jgi:hypothetical protein
MEAPKAPEQVQITPTVIGAPVAAALVVDVPVEDAFLLLEEQAAIARASVKAPTPKVNPRRRIRSPFRSSFRFKLDTPRLRRSQSGGAALSYKVATVETAQDGIRWED